MEPQPEITYYTDQQEFNVYVIKHTKGRLIDEEIKGFPYGYDSDDDSLDDAVQKANEYILQIQSITR